ncbi:glutathione S-transferase family protein [Novosphingobium sp.]|uniref:glutathione S-transferase family protein n=1 Tax=Novosphingobium sp. TaxID=1874826 RepID=UPI0038BB3CAE
MTITITGFASSPDRGRGLARDMRVRWALEEVGQAYAMRLLSFAELKQAAHIAHHPFGQIPTYEDGQGLVLFEAGAIVLHIAENHVGLLPVDPQARSRAIMWMFAALNTVEPVLLERETAMLIERERDWHHERLPLIEQRIRERLGQLSDRLGDAEWLDDEFSAGDLMMASVLIRTKSSGLMDEHANLVAYVARAEARPAYQRAFAAQLAIYEASLNA